MQLHPGAQTVARAADLLDLYTPERRDLSVADVADALAIVKSAAHRLLSTLRDCGYLRQDRATSRYALGAKVLLLAEVYRLDRDLPRIALPHMQRLLREINESVALYVREGNARYCIAQLESSHVVRVVIRVGQRMPLGRGAAGRLLVMTDAQARAAGAVISRGERVPNACGIAAGIFNANGELLAALDVSGPLDRITESTAQRYAEIIVAAAANLSSEFSYHPTVPSE